MQRIPIRIGSIASTKKKMERSIYKVSPDMIVNKMYKAYLLGKIHFRRFFECVVTYCNSEMIGEITRKS